ncbi:hypothetical protein [Streptomyces griseoruber]|uniref:MmyB family transcriptional regulator n=1 Tax=Streptomyces griseoruber TaxID=1943 RepID=UPI001F0A351F|nr:hypothetical protein [Streptomyces griseoruber]
MRSDTFRRPWAEHDVLAHTTGSKRLHHPLVGDLTLEYVVLAVEGDPDQTLIVHTPEPAGGHRRGPRPGRREWPGGRVLVTNPGQDGRNA